MKNHSATTLPGISFSNEEALSIILNNLNEVLILVDKTLRIVHITEQAKERVQKNFGLTITKDTSILELVAPERHAFMLQLYEDVFSGKERTTTTQVKSVSGFLIFETHFKPARNAEGDIIGAVLCSKDITEIRRKEDTLKKAEERWRFALEGGNQGVWDWNVQTGDIFFSDSYKKLYGYSSGDLQGRIEEWEKMIHPDDKERMNGAIDEHLASSEPYYESTYRVKTKEGNYKWVLGRGMLMRGENGEAVRMIGTHTDITQQITAERTYKLLFYSNPLPMWTYDLETLRILTVNDAAINHYGYSKEEFLSMTIKDIRPAETVKDLLEMVNKRKTLGSLKFSTQHLKKNGELITVELSTHRLEDSNTVLVVAQDITAKMKAEEELRQSNERFLLASRATSDAIYDWDILAGSIHWGEGLQTLFGFNPREVPASLWENLIHPDDRPRIKDSIQSALAHPKKTYWKDEYRFAKADGSFSYVLDRGFIIRDQNQNALRIIGSMQDITDRKYTEQILSLERSVFELSNKTDVDLKYLIEKLLSGLEEIHEEAYTSFLILKEDNTAETFVAPRLPKEYIASINGFEIGPDSGACGTAMWRKETVIVDDINTNPLWEKRKSLPLQYGLQSCWSFPIIHTSGKVMGTFAIYYKARKSPSKSELNTLERIRNIIRILMEYHWSLDEIKKVNERFDIVLKATHDLIWDWNLETNLIYHDPIGLQKVYGIENNTAIEKIEQWLGHIHPADFNRVQNVVSEVFQAKERNTFDMEYRFRGDDGQYSYVYDRGMVLRNVDGKPVRIIGAAQNITERKLLEEELLRNELEKQKAINQATVDSQELERTEIGKELHDNVNQILTTTKLYLDLALSNAELRDELITKSSRNIISVINEIRQLSRSLMDPTIGDLGLIDSVNDLIENINLTRRVHVSLTADQKLESMLTKNHKLTVFRILQEALNNAMKHAKAKMVTIDLRIEQDNILNLTVADDGVGFNPSLVKLGAGIKNIQNRVYLVNGTCAISSDSQKGCKIIINFPI